jgi:hypothetical protein
VNRPRSFYLLFSSTSLWRGPRPGGLTLRLRGSWGTEVRGWSSLALAAQADIFLSS